MAPTSRPSSPGPISTTPASACRSTSCAQFSSPGCAGACEHAYDHVPHYRAALDEIGFAPADLRELADLRHLPFTDKATCARSTRSGCSPCPATDVSRVHASSGTTGQPTVVGYTRGDLDRWSDLMARSIRAAGGRPGRPGPRGVRLRALHRRPRCALRRRASGLHGRPGLRRHDRSAGPVDHRPQAAGDHGYAVVLPGAAGRAPGCRARSINDPARGRDLRRRAVDRRHAGRDRGPRRPPRGRHLRAVGGHGPRCRPGVRRDEGRSAHLGGSFPAGDRGSRHRRALDPTARSASSCSPR